MAGSHCSEANRHRADPLSLAHQVDEHPAAVALLDVPAVEHCELAAAQGAAQKHRQNRAVPFSFNGLDLGLSKQVAPGGNRILIIAAEYTPPPADHLALLEQGELFAQVEVLGSECA